MKILLVCVLGLIILAICQFSDIRFATFLFGLSSFVLGVLLISREKAIRNKLWSIVLVIALSCAPFASEARPEPPPNDGDAVALACAALLVGGVVCYGLWKLCQRIPAPPCQPPPPPPFTNYPPVIINPTNTHRPSIKMSLNSYSATTIRDISAQAMPDTIGGGQFHTIWWVGVDSSTDLAHWSRSLTVTGYVSDAGQQLTFWTNGQCAFNAYLTRDCTNPGIPLEIGNASDPRKFFRAIVP